MPWKRTDIMTERIKMLTDHLSGDYTATALARKYAVSRKCVYKWLGRYEADGWSGLEDESQAPHQQASAIDAEVEESILELKARWPDWGAPKLRRKLEQIIGTEICPAESTVSAVLKRHGLVKVRRPRSRAVPGGLSPMEHCRGANLLRGRGDRRSRGRARRGRRNRMHSRAREHGNRFRNEVQYFVQISVTHRIAAF